MKTIKTEVINGIGIIRFNRPDVRNAVNLDMMDEFFSQLQQWRNNAELKVLVLTGVGPHAFVSGGDVEQLHQFKTKETIQPVLKRMAEILHYLKNYSKPTIAMINGYAIGGGCEIATACDFRFASETAKLGFVQINIGITTGWGGGTRLIRMLGRSKALEMLLTGKRYEASEALRIGFIDKLFSLEELENETLAFAALIANKNDSVVRHYIEMANELDQMTDAYDSIQAETVRCSELWEKKEHIEAVETFLRETRNKL